MNITKLFEKWSKDGDVSPSTGSHCLAHSCPFAFDWNSLLPLTEFFLNCFIFILFSQIYMTFLISEVL